MRTLILLIALSGCGGNSEAPEDNHGYGWQYDALSNGGLRLRKAGATSADADFLEERFKTVLTCLGISAPPPPFVVFVPAGTLGPPTEGRYLSGPPLVLLENDIYFEHEAIHYLLDVTTGNPDARHESRAFLCSPTD